MENSELINNPDNPEQKVPVLVTFQLLGVILRLIGFLIIGLFIATFITSFLYGINIKEITPAVLNNKNFLLTYQAMQQLFSFLILPIIYILFLKKHLAFEIFQMNRPHLAQLMILGVLIVLFCIPLVNWLVTWNESIELPSFMESIEKWMKAKEAQAKEATNLIAYYNGQKEFIIGLIVIGFLPAIGEEFLFRGVIQNEIKEYSGNPHFAIWAAAFIFSFFHFQFYGFFPRMLLGATFGYLYYWSGSLIIPILGHLFNNGLTYILLNLYKQKAIELNPESSDIVPWYTMLFSSIIFIFLLLSFKKISAERKEITPQE